MHTQLIRLVKRFKIIHRLFKTINRTVSFSADIPELTPFDIRASEIKDIRVNILVPSINQEHVFGGISTALSFFNEFAEYLGIKRRIITTDASPGDDDILSYPGYSVVKFDKDSHADLQIVPFSDRYNKTIPVWENDIFIATAWWTAYAAQGFIHKQTDMYNIPVNRLIYFIQDFEPGFYPWGSHYALAESTYKSKLPQTAVFNTYYLKHYFENINYIFDEVYHFEPKLNTSLKKQLDNITEFKKKKQIIIYGRPGVKRNAFELIITVLKQFVWKQNNIADWTLLSIGEPHPDIELGNNIILKAKGKLTIDEYSRVLAESYLGISLMVSPHPSYPPFEMSVYGVNVITNMYANKDLSSFSTNIISLPELNVDSIVESMTKVCNDYKECVRKEIVNQEFLDNTKQFAFIDKIHLRMNL